MVPEYWDQIADFAANLTACSSLPFIAAATRLKRGCLLQMFLEIAFPPVYT